MSCFFLSSLQTLLKTVYSGDYSPYVRRAFLYALPGVKGREETTFVDQVFSPLIILSEDRRQQSWGMIGQIYRSSEAERVSWGLRDLFINVNTLCIAVAVSVATGRILYQSFKSVSVIGACDVLTDSSSYALRSQ